METIQNETLEFVLLCYHTGLQGYRVSRRSQVLDVYLKTHLKTRKGENKYVHHKISCD